MELGDTLLTLRDFAQFIGPAKLIVFLGILIMGNIMLMVEW